MQTNNQHDIVVIGAGPSGARTAETLASQGLSVALVERNQEPGNPVHCTGIVSTECFDRYHLPDSLIINSIKSFRLISPSGRKATIRREATQAHVLDRVALDNLLVERAVNAGAHLFTSTDVTNIQWSGSCVNITSRREGVPFSITAPMSVLATGFGTRLTKQAGFSRPNDFLSGCQAVVEAEAVEELEVFTGANYGAGGFGWLVPWKSGYALTGLMTRRYTMEYLNKHIERLQNSDRIGQVRTMYRCRAIPLGLTNRSVSDGILGVGDVVGQIKPTSGGGIYFGMLSADIAAPVIVEALRVGDTSRASLEAYEQQWRQLLESEIDQGYALRRLIEQLPDSVVEHLHRLLKIPGLQRLLAGGTASFDWHGRPLTGLLAKLQRQAISMFGTTPIP